MLNTGDFNGADRRFASAVKLESDYGFQIGGAYKQAGMEAMKKSNNNALAYFNKAVEFQPDLKAVIGDLLMEKGIANMNGGHDHKAIDDFKAAVTFKPDLKPQVSELCIDRGKQLLAQGSTQNGDSITSETHERVIRPTQGRKR